MSAGKSALARHEYYSTSAITNVNEQMEFITCQIAALQSPERSFVVREYHLPRDLNVTEELKDALFQNGLKLGKIIVNGRDTYYRIYW